MGVHLPAAFTVMVGWMGRVDGRAEGTLQHRSRQSSVQGSMGRDWLIRSEYPYRKEEALGVCPTVCRELRDVAMTVD